MQPVASSGLAIGQCPRYDMGMFDFVISIVILAACALLGGAFVLHRKGNTRQATLMALLAVVMAVNVAIWLVPTADGDSLADAAARPGD